MHRQSVQIGKSFLLVCDMASELFLVVDSDSGRPEADSASAFEYSSPFESKEPQLRKESKSFQFYKLRQKFRRSLDRKVVGVFRRGLATKYRIHGFGFGRFFEI